VTIDMIIDLYERTCALAIKLVVRHARKCVQPLIPIALHINRCRQLLSDVRIVCDVEASLHCRDVSRNLLCLPTHALVSRWTSNDSRDACVH
jgi:hypothetical protein